jgi:uncharacterized protein (TIGR04141 family)
MIWRGYGMANTRKKRNKLSIYLLKDGHTNKENFLLDGALKEQDLGNGIVVYKTQIPSRTPSWVSDFFNNKIDDLYTSGAGAIVKIPMEIGNKNKTFLLSFGYGFSKIDTSTCEERFGLKIALNAGNTDMIRSISRKSISATPKISLEQLARLEPLSSFGVDVDQDIMQSLVLSSNNVDEYGKTIVGGISLQINSTKTINDIKELLPKIYKDYTLDDYKSKGYDWIDNVSPVRDKGQIELLNTDLVTAFNNYSEDDNRGLVAAPPDLVKWDDVMGFSNNGREKSGMYDDINISSYKPEAGEDADIGYIKSANVFLWKSTSDSSLERWSLFKCLVFDVAVDDRHYLLNNGKWYEIDQNYANSIDKWYKGLTIVESTLPEYNKISEDGKLAHSEKSYNESVNDHDVLDRDLIEVGNMKNIEACDLYKDRNFIHIKIFTGSSAPISHLLAQASISARLFFSEKTFRSEINKKITVKLSDEEVSRPTRDDYTITLGVITNKDNLELPFFSKINLKAFYTQLRLMGIDNIVIERIKGNW